MAKKKKEKTPEEIAEHNRVKKINSEARKLATAIKNNCNSIGLRAIKLQLDWLKGNQTALPSPYLSKEETISAWEKGIKQYEEILGLAS